MEFEYSMDFIDEVQNLSAVAWADVASRLGYEDLTLSEVMGLLSPEADGHLEEMAKAAHSLTVKNFGRTIKLYSPLYISNSCINGCLYCGFSSRNAIERKTLGLNETLAEAEVIVSAGHRHILVVAGEDPHTTPIEFIEEVAAALRPRVAGLQIETQAFDETGYRRLSHAGVDGVTLYQETYDRKSYEKVHPYGPKRIFGARTSAIDAAGSAGMRFLGIGALLGLFDWRREAISLIAHARWLMKRHWRAFVTVSVPRIRDSASGFKMPSPVSDRDLAHLICVLRLSLPHSGISLSTREDAKLRGNLLPLGITQMSAGSVTSPGGYTKESVSGEQFQLEDCRSPQVVAEMLMKAGYDPVWKDWAKELS